MPSRRKVAATVIGAIGAAAAAYLAVKKAGESRAKANRAAATPLSSTTRAARTADVARIGAKAGSAYAVNRAQRAFASAERKEELDTELQLKTAEQGAEALGHMKGA